MPKKDAKDPPKEKIKGDDGNDDNNGKDKGKKGKKGPPPKPVVSHELALSIMSIIYLLNLDRITPCCTS